MRRSGTGSRWAAVALAAGLVIGLLLTSPAGAHFQRSISHIIQHAKQVFVQRAWAVVDDDGTLVRDQHATGVSTPLPEGQYDVAFDRNVTRCAYVATPGDPGTTVVFSPTFISVSRTPGTNNSVRVETKNAGGGLSDQSFHLQVVC
jgi:hypothetical protein